MDFKKYIKELKRRNVFKVAVTYGITAWLLLQITETIVPIITAPNWLLKVVLILLIIGFPLALICAWAFEMTHEGIKKTEDVDIEKSDLEKPKNGYNKLIISVLIIALVFLLMKPYWQQKLDKIKGSNQIEYIDSIQNKKVLPSNLNAYDFYLKGELRYKKGTLSDIDTAIMYFNEAIKIDPKYAQAYNDLASAYMRKYLFFDPNTKWEEEAYSAAGKALAIDPNLANPHLIKGQFYWSQSHNFAHEQAYNEFVKAIEKDPKLSQAYEQLALVQLHIGLFDDAYKNAHKSVELDPSNFKARQFIGEALLFQGNYNSSMREFEKIPENFTNPHTQSLKALNFFYLNQPEKSIEILNDKLKNSPNSPNLNSVYAIILASKGQVSDALQKKEIALEHSKDYIHAHHIYYHLGLMAALMTEKQEAVEWLDKAAETGFPNYPLFSSDPNLENLKGYFEYEELLTKLKEKWKYFKTL